MNYAFFLLLVATNLSVFCEEVNSSLENTNANTNTRKFLEQLDNIVRENKISEKNYQMFLNLSVLAKLEIEANSHIDQIDKAFLLKEIAAVPGDVDDLPDRLCSVCNPFIPHPHTQFDETTKRVLNRIFPDLAFDQNSQASLYYLKALDWTLYLKCSMSQPIAQEVFLNIKNRGVKFITSDDILPDSSYQEEGLEWWDIRSLKGKISAAKVELTSEKIVVEVGISNDETSAQSFLYIHAFSY